MVDKIILELPADTVGGDILVSTETRERAEAAAAAAESTAAGMVVSGTVAGDNLVLTKADSTTVVAGNVRGPKGNDGSNVLPADEAIAQAISTPGSETQTQLNATFVPISDLPQVYAATSAAVEAAPTRVGRNTDAQGSLTPDGRTKYVLMSGQPDQVFTNFTGGWDTSAQSSDTTRVKAGAASRRLETPSAGTFTCRWYQTGTFAPASLLQAWVWIDDPTKVSSIGFRPCAGWTRAFTGPFQAGWNLIRFRASAGALTSWGTVEYTLLTVVTTGAVGINIGEVWVECPPKAQICFIEDRGYTTFKQFGVPDLRELGIPIVWALDPALNGSSPGTSVEVISDADVATFYNAGDDISIHSWDGAPTATKTPDEIREDSLRALAWLQDRGYEQGRLFRAAWTQNVAENHVAAQPYFAAYATPINASATVETWPPIDKFNVGRYQLHGRTNAQFDALFDTLQKTHQIIFAYTHGIHDAQSGAISHAEWDYFISKCSDGISEGWLEGVTFTQLLESSGGIVR